MSEQKKPKIDLKARLGKKTVAGPSGGPPIPPPVGIPRPPAMGGGGGALGGLSPSQAPPRLSPSNPYAAVGNPYAAQSNPYAAQSNPYSDAPPQRMAPSAITVEMSEEVLAQQRRGQRKSYMFGIVLSGIAAFIGFAWGGRVEAGKGATAALDGAHELVKDIEASDKVADQLNDVLSKAADKLVKNEYPAEEVSKLGEINIPFDGGHLTDKGIGRFKREVVTMLINYANTSQKANEQKERIQNLLAGSKDGITELLTQQTDPKIRWSVIVSSSPGGPWASMQVLPAAFPMKSDKDWPADITLMDGKDKETVKRFKSGDPSSGDPQFIPVNPQTESMVCPSTTIVRLRTELVDMQTVLKGDNTPGQEKTGLLQLGDVVVAQLKKIGT